MNKTEKTPKLPITNEERAALRKNKIKLGHLKSIDPKRTIGILEIDIKRAIELHALALFQSIPSVGPSLAKNVVWIWATIHLMKYAIKKGKIWLLI